MSWPAVAGVTPGFFAPGANNVTTIRWGTEGLLQSPKPPAGYYTVTNFDQRQLVEPIKYPNGVGVTATRILLIDGDEFTITVRDDSRMSPPRAGTTISIVDAGGHIGTPGLVYSAVVIDANYKAAPKQPGERNIRAESLILVDSRTSGAQV